MDPQWIIAISSSIAALAIVGVVVQSRAAISQLKISSSQLESSINQLKSDHERSRRELAVDLLCKWDGGLKRECAVARKFAETLNFNQSKALSKQQTFEIISEHYELFLGSLSSAAAERRNSNKNDDKKIQLSERESSEIRWAVICFLNQLETTLTAVRHNVADKAIIYEQFKYLISPSNGHYVLEDFRKAAGGSATYPSIEAFVSELKTEIKQVVPGKPRIACSGCNAGNYLLADSNIKYSIHHSGLRNSRPASYGK